jgi:hypothetical protein
MNGFFHTDILKCYYSFKPDMRGRTSVFENLNHAVIMFNKMKNFEQFSGKLEVWMAKVENDLMEGFYGFDEVVAGRKIKFIKKVDPSSWPTYLDT